MKVYAHWDGDPQFTLIAVVADRAAATSAGGTSAVRTAGELIARFASAFNAKVCPCPCPCPSSFISHCHLMLSPHRPSLLPCSTPLVLRPTSVPMPLQPYLLAHSCRPCGMLTPSLSLLPSVSPRAPHTPPYYPTHPDPPHPHQHPSHAPLSPSLLSLHKSRGQEVGGSTALSKAVQDLDDLFVRHKPPPHKPSPPQQQQQGAANSGKSPVQPPDHGAATAPTAGPPTRSPPSASQTTAPPPAPAPSIPSAFAKHLSSSSPVTSVPSSPAATTQRTTAASHAQSPLALPLVRHAAQQLLQAQRKGQYKHAMLLANELLAVVPNLKLAYRALAAMHMAISRHDRALPVLQAAVAAHPSDPLLHLRLAQATLHLQQPTEALPLADRALSLATKQGWPQHSKRRGAGKGGRGGGMVGVLGSKQSAARMMRRARVSGQQAAEMFGLPEDEEEDDEEEGDGGKAGKGEGMKTGGAGGAWDVDSPYAGDPHGDVSLDDIKVECGRALLQAGAVDVAAAVVAGVLQGDEHHEGALLLYGDVLLQQKKAQAGTHTPQGNPAERPEGSGAKKEVGGEGEGGRMQEEEEAMKAYLRVLLAHPQHSTARAKIAHVLQHHASARRLLLSQLRAGAGAPADTARALVFFASACKDHSALDAACEFMQVAVALAPGSSSHVLALLHLHEVMLNGCAALHLARSFCEARPGFRLGPITLGSVLPFFEGLPLHPGSCEDVSPCPHERGVQLEFLRRWDGGGAQEGGCDELGAGSAGVASRGAESNGADSKGDGGGEGGEVAGVGMGKEEYNSEQLDVLALLMTTVKALFLGGAVQRAKAVGALVERARLASVTPLHQTLIRNEAAYFGCAFQLLTQYPIPHSLSDSAPKPLFLAGDSHCMAAAWRVVQLRGRPRLLCPVLITGLKAWHLRPESTFFPKASFHRAMQRVPQGSEVVVLFGEIDCREGILISVDRTKYKDVEEGVEVTVDIYIAVLLSLIAARAFEIFVHPVPSVIPETRPLARIYNATLRCRCLAAAASPAAGGRLHMLDFFNGLLTDDQESLRREFEFDGTHMSPLYVPLLDKELSRIDAE
ncbi:unnamed protein product [Closterium sp. NIES-64]|nr:unnamed protein product [Closterium sp. NIES-64]